MSNPTAFTKDKWIVYIVAAVLSTLIGGGSGMAIDTHEQAELRKEVALLQLRIATLESAGTEQSKQLKDIEGKIDEGNDYIRDEVVKALSQMQADIAVLKARR